MIHLIITGERRSGTTLMANLLNAQPGVTLYRDFLHIHQLGQHVGARSLRDYLTGAQKDALLRRFNAVDNAKIGLDVQVRHDEFGSLANFYKVVLERIENEADKVVGHKTTIAHDIIDDLLDTFSCTRALYMLRDPRDVVVSALSRFTGKTSEGLFDYIEGWRRSFCTIQQVLRDRTDARLLVVRYEDLVTDREQTLGMVASFLGFQDIAVPNELDDYGQKWRGNSSFGDGNDTLDCSPVGRWRHKNCEAGLTAEIALGKLLVEAGYEPSNGIRVDKRGKALLSYARHRLARGVASPLARWMESALAVSVRS